MARLLVCDNSGNITVDVEAFGPILGAALEDEQAEPVVRCAVLMALSALAEGGGWPTAALQTLAEFMAGMKDEVRNMHLM
jgi:hypothetical protein